MSIITAIPPIEERSEGTPGLWNARYNIIADNLAGLQAGPITSPSINTISLFTSLDASGNINATEQMGIGPTHSATTTALLTNAAS